MIFLLEEKFQDAKQSLLFYEPDAEYSKFTLETFEGGNDATLGRISERFITLSDAICARDDFLNVNG